MTGGKAMTDVVAVFVDFENLRYGLLNNYGQEPDIRALVEKAKKYGRPSVMRAYADFSEHPEHLNRQLQIQGVEAITVPVKRTVYPRHGGPSVERVKNSADMVLAIDAVMEALEADRERVQKTFLLVTGDRDYIKLVTILRNRFGQRVVIAGVPGSIAGDLVAAADDADHIEVTVAPPTDKRALKVALVAMVKAGPAPLTYWSMKILDQWAQDGRKGIPGSAKEKRDAFAELMNEGVLTQREIVESKRGRTVRETLLDEARARGLGYIA